MWIVTKISKNSNVICDKIKAMIGFILVLVASFWEEVGSSIGKLKVQERKESIYTFGFLSLLWGTIFLFITAIVRNDFVFSPASLPTLGIRIILEVLQVHVSILAITRADRSTFGFLRILTIPLLLTTDIVLGYTIGTNEIIGISVIVVALIFLFINHGIKKEGAWLVIFTAINAVATISLYKYNITHFNSVEVEQIIVHIVLLAYFIFMAIQIAKENPFRFLRNPVFFAQSAAAGVGTVLLSFAYLFGSASVITTIKRAAAIFWAMLSGNRFFKEKGFFIKLLSLVFIVIGLIFLAL